MTRSAKNPFGLTGFLALLAGIFYPASGPGGYRLAFFLQEGLLNATYELIA